MIDRITIPNGDAKSTDRVSPIMIYAVIEILLFVTCALLSLVFSQFDSFYAWIHQWIPDSPVLFNVLFNIVDLVQSQTLDNVVLETEFDIDDLTQSQILESTEVAIAIRRFTSKISNV